MYHGGNGAVEKLGKVVAGGCPWQVANIQGATSEVEVFVVVSVGRFSFATVNAYNDFASVNVSAVGAFDGALGITFTVEAYDGAVATGATIFADDDLSSGAVVWAVDTDKSSDVVVHGKFPTKIDDILFVCLFFCYFS